jgi:hypothetical protein
MAGGAGLLVQGTADLWQDLNAERGGVRAGVQGDVLAGHGLCVVQGPGLSDADVLDV